MAILLRQVSNRARMRQATDQQRHSSLHHQGTSVTSRLVSLPQSALQPVRNPLCACLYFPVCIAARSPLSVSIFLHESMFLIPCVCLCVCLCTTKYDCTCVHISNTGFAGIKHSQWPRVLLTCKVYHHLIVSLIRM